VTLLFLLFIFAHLNASLLNKSIIEEKQKNNLTDSKLLNGIVYSNLTVFLIEYSVKGNTVDSDNM